MKRIEVTLKREIVVEVLIDESVIDLYTLERIKDLYDPNIFREPTTCDDKLTKYEIGMYAYAVKAAEKKVGTNQDEYICFNQGHTHANILFEESKAGFEKMQDVLEYLTKK